MKKRQTIRKVLLLISFILYPITFLIFSPDMLLFGASKGIVAGDVVFFCGLFLISLIGGRLFCGWICPSGGLQEFSSYINDKPVNNRWNWIKMAIFIPWFGCFLFLAIGAGGFKQLDFFYNRAFDTPVVGIVEWIMYLMTVAFILILTLATGKRGFCHYLCWISPFMIIGGAIRARLKLPALHLRTSPESCNSCGQCARKCPMSLPVDTLVKTGVINHSECILCGSCVDTCPKGTIRFALQPLCYSKKHMKKYIIRINHP